MDDLMEKLDAIKHIINELEEEIKILELDLRDEEQVSIKESDLWSLDLTLCDFILPRLKAFKEINTNSYPIDFKNMEEWHKVIDKMIFAFQIIKDDTWNGFQEETIKKYNEGMHLFAEHFCSLWD